jgi:RNA polymerase sigma factor (sigma-70 family)
MAITDAQAGAPTLEELFHTHYVRLARIIWRVVGDNAEAEELASEVFVRYHRQPPQQQTNIEAWLCRTAVHLAFDSLRKRDTRKRYEDRSPRPAGPADPERELEQQSERARVRETLAFLRPEQSELLLLHAEGYSYAEIATMQGVNAASVGTKIARAQAAFKEEYVQRYGSR